MCHVFEKILYRAEAIATGGRDGRAVSSDGTLDVKLSTPRYLGSAGGEKALRRIIAATAFGLVATAGSAAHAAGSPGVEHNTQAFLQALEAGGGEPIEQLSPKVLTGAQASVKLQLHKADIRQKIIHLGLADASRNRARHVARKTAGVCEPAISSQS